MRPALRFLGAVALLAALCAPDVASAARFPQRVGGQYRYWAFEDGNDLRDVLAYWAIKPVHVQLEYWDFMEGDDQFRPEVGVHLFDRRRSVYTIQWRREGVDRHRFTFATEQVVAAALVARGEVSPILTEGEETDWVLGVGLDYYWGSYNFAQATMIRDPRSGGLWVFPMRVRLANEANDWLQFTLAPASERSLGWAIDGKYKWFRTGLERNSRYDFTDVDNIIYTIGFELLLPAGR